MIAEIIKEALPIARALMELIDLASDWESGALSEEDVKDEIKHIREWVEAAKKREADLWAAAASQSDDG